ncbi:hypothetical protein SAMN02745945_02897 [Peptoclostridium litorale DSM 5388]|uniref:Regulatory protein n=1 Tax=Peptoclostridium litorale DSM 5388 TaxID=1121324 RepID=A0A069RJV5_PEPLI|nr:PTS sugar transporter subunit IIC [Peptoclostridium litorale]KDR94512.1 regulatory protein [Peptoclostridium litorale DSM 5388]SIO35332.1 hypothetical protein SAMN02745945_02897 [Peptoclostridium litorale DSM 5388]
MRNYLTKTLNGMALGLFGSLIIGLILKQAGDLLGIEAIGQFGRSAQYLMGPAIGAGVAFSLGSPPIVIFTSIITGALGAGSIRLTDAGAMIGIGEPVGAYIAALIGAEIGRRISGKTKVDIVVVPAVTIICGGAAGSLIAPVVSVFMKNLGGFINMATELQPLPMGIVVAAAMGMILTMPVSSAALSIALGLDGLAAGAALVGCSTQMIGFAVISYKENGFGGLIAQGLGTSMLQVPNIIKNPYIWIPPTLASAILGPVSTVIMKMQTSSIGAGMGTSGLVGQIATVSVMGASSIPKIILMHFILPAALTLAISKYMISKGYIKYSDMKLES